MIRYVLAALLVMLTGTMEIFPQERSRAREMGRHYMAGRVPDRIEGSCMIVIATDAPLSARNLKRLARRSFLAFGRVGGFSSNGSGDYAIAFSTHPDLRIPHHSAAAEQAVLRLRNDRMTPFFLAVVEATEEAIYNSLFMATRMEGQSGRSVEALPIRETLEIMDKYNARHEVRSRISGRE